MQTEEGERVVTGSPDGESCPECGEPFDEASWTIARESEDEYGLVVRYNCSQGYCDGQIVLVADS